MPTRANRRTSSPSPQRGQRLRTSRDSEPGWRRRRCGRGFVYLDDRGCRITDADALVRIRQLAIPPAYRDVWICADPHGHLQATARDARGRKQYRYHPRWQQLRDGDKFRRVRALGRRLPALRRRVACDLRRAQLDRDRVLAAAVKLLDLSGIRIGSQAYLLSNRSYGLTTLRDRHLDDRDGQTHLRFRGKSGVIARVDVDHLRLTQTLRACRRLRGDALLQYVKDKNPRTIDAGEVNDYLRRISGVDFSAKDLRTWKANVLLLGCLRRTAADGRRDRRGLKAAIDEVAATLGHTATVCRRSYLDPAIIRAYTDGTLAAVRPLRLAGLGIDERRYLALTRR